MYTIDWQSLWSDAKPILAIWGWLFVLSWLVPYLISRAIHRGKIDAFKVEQKNMLGQIMGKDEGIDKKEG